MCNEDSHDNMWLERTRCEFSVRTLKKMEVEETRKPTAVEHTLCTRCFKSQWNHSNALR